MLCGAIISGMRPDDRISRRQLVGCFIGTTFVSICLTMLGPIVMLWWMLIPLFCGYLIVSRGSRRRKALAWSVIASFVFQVVSLFLWLWIEFQMAGKRWPWMVEGLQL